MRILSQLLKHDMPDISKLKLCEVVCSECDMSRKRRMLFLSDEVQVELASHRQAPRTRDCGID